MINIFKKNKDKKIINDQKYINIAALLIHAAKIDEKYTEKEKDIIKKIIEEISNKKIEINNLISDAEKLESNSNQILDFTKEVKNIEESLKIKILETIWRIIYSDKKADIYETNLMRRLTGLLYIDAKTLGDIKNKIYKENNK